MRMRYFSLCVAFTGAVMFAGCGGEPPTSDLAAAKQALEGARDVGAEQFASQQYSVAEEAYSAAEKAVNDASAEMISDFAESQALINDAKSKADDAKAVAETEKGRQRGSAESSIAAASDVIDQARNALAGAPVGKGTEGDIQQLQDELGAAEAEIGAAKSAVASENFSNAEMNAKSAQQKAQIIVAGAQDATKKHEDLVEKSRPWYDRI
ncbi:MAG: hypothetical protein VX294_04930 [Candidatus Latescibacterota bacterium]|nr:hypothetical protein [Candidatus Latescibacterota bacterium]